MNTDTPMQPAPAAPLKTSVLAVVAFILSLLCLPGLIGLILGIVALVQISDKKKNLKGKGLAIAAIALGALWLPAGVLAGIAVPNFKKFQARAKQAEAKANLKVIASGQSMFFLETKKYATTFEELSFQPDGTTRYSYFLGDSVMKSERSGAHALPDGIKSYVQDSTFQAVAVGNIDSDETLDVWVINQDNKLENLVNDVAE